MNQLLADGEIAVASGRGKFTVGLIEGEGEYIGRYTRKMPYAFSPLRCLDETFVRARSKNFMARVPRMNLQGHIKKLAERLSNMGDLLGQKLEKLSEFRTNLGVFPQDGYTLRKRHLFGCDLIEKL